MELFIFLDLLSQSIAVITGCWSMWLVNQKHEEHPNKRWACILGLISEPFWLYTLIFHGQWIAIIIKLFYTYSWSLGIYNFWIKPYLEKKKKYE
jgi:hypothetical protein